MANYEIQQIDLDMLQSRYNTIWIKLELANIYETVNGVTKFNSGFKPIADISGELKSGSYSCDSTSDIRRTLDLDFLVKNDNSKISANQDIWINKFIVAYLGVSTFYVENITYYPLGIYIIDTAHYSYSIDDNSLSLSCVDLVALLNGERNGIIPAMLSMKIEGRPEICNATISADNTNQIVTIDIKSGSYMPLTNISGDAPPYFDCDIGFNISSYNLPNVKSYYNDYSVMISVNGFTPYYMKELSIDGETVTFETIHIKQDYVCNFGGNHSDNYCFIFYGKPNTISGAMRKTIEQFSPFQCLIEEIGSEVTTFDGSNATYVPYTLDFNTGKTQWDVITKLRDLYSGWKTLFDVYGTFICHKIPTCENDEIVLSEDVFDPLVISEKTTYDLKSVKNVTEVWGKCQETDRYDTEPNITIDIVNQKVIIDLSLPLYACDTIGNHNKPYVYSNSELLGFTMPNIDSQQRRVAEENKYPLYLRVNYASDSENLPEILLINDYTNKTPSTFDMLQDGLGYCVQPKYNDDKPYAIYTGEFQIHAVCMLVDKEPDEVQKVQDKLEYNCSQISYIYSSGNITTYDIYGNPYTRYEENNCPYTIEKLGKITQSFSGDDYEDIYSTDLARQRAEYETWKAGRLTDSLTLETRLIPFLDCDIKIKYTSKQTGQVDTYIIDKVQHSFDSCTTTIEMHKFYPTYPFIVK